MTLVAILCLLALAVAGCVKYPRPESGHTEAAREIYQTIGGISEDWVRSVQDVTVSGDQVVVWSTSAAPLDDPFAHLDGTVEFVLQRRDEQVFNTVVVRNQATGKVYGSRRLHHLPSAGDEFGISKQVTVRIPRGWLGDVDPSGESLRLVTWRRDGIGTGARFETQPGQVVRGPGSAKLTGMHPVKPFYFRGIRVIAQLKHTGADGVVERDESGGSIGVIEDDPKSWGTVASIMLVPSTGKSVHAIAEFNEVPVAVAKASGDRAVVTAILRMFLVASKP